jgi:hypothetical protein
MPRAELRQARCHAPAKAIGVGLAGKTLRRAASLDSGLRVGGVGIGGLGRVETACKSLLFWSERGREDHVTAASAYVIMPDGGAGAVAEPGG